MCGPGEMDERMGNVAEHLVDRLVDHDVLLLGAVAGLRLAMWTSCRGAVSGSFQFWLSMFQLKPADSAHQHPRDLSQCGTLFYDWSRPDAFHTIIRVARCLLDRLEQSRSRPISN